MILAMRAGSLSCYEIKMPPKPPGFSKIRRGPGTFLAEIPTTAEPNHDLSPSFPRTPLSPPQLRSKGGFKALPPKANS